jgi:hypothetical protein
MPASVVGAQLRGFCLSHFRAFPVPAEATVIPLTFVALSDFRQAKVTHQ